MADLSIVGFDLETEGDLDEYMLQPFRCLTGEARIKAASISVGDKTAGRLYPEPNQVKKMLNYAIMSNSYITGWNVAFDAAWCIAIGLENEVFQAKWLDAMLLWRHAVVEPEGDDIPKSKRKSYSLESAMHEFYPDEAGFKDFDDFAATDDDSMKLLLHRNEMDALWTARLAEKFWRMLGSRQRNVARIEARCIPMMAKNKVLGIKSTKEDAQVLADILGKEAIEIYRELISVAPEARGVNIGSPKQLQKLIYETWGMVAERFSKKTQLPSTDKYALYDLALIDPRCGILKKLREAKGNRKKYAIGTINSLEYNGDGFVRPQPKIFSTYTSRITYASSDTCKRKVLKTYKRKPDEWIEKKVKVPVGIALHQWKRGQVYRRLIRPPEGYYLAEFDFAGQEFRWMAVASGDETMLSLCAPGEDAHSYMGAQIAQRDYKQLAILAKSGDDVAENDRKCGKFCIAEGELVLTDKGLIPIEQISLDDQVWDGIDWVNHEGVINQGYKEVITYEGLTATKDHEVYTENGKVRFGEAAKKGYSLTITGDGRYPVRKINYRQHKYQTERQEKRSMCTLQMHMRRSFVDLSTEFDQGQIYTMQKLCICRATFQKRSCNYKQQSCNASTEKMQCNEAEMREPQRPKLCELWSQRDTLQIQYCCRSYCIYVEQSTTFDVFRIGDRSHQQQRSLRTWKFATDHQDREHEQQTNKQVSEVQRGTNSEKTRIPCTENFIPSCEICRRCNYEPRIERTNHRKNSRAVGKTKHQTKRVYDIANAGPRHRFTVSGCLVSNCNLSYQYRVSARTATTKARIDYELDVDEQFISHTQAIYKESYPGVGGPPGRRVGGYWASQIAKCKELGYAETFAGRRVQLKDNWAGRFKWPMESTAINYPIQGTGGDQKYLALAVARNMLAQFGGYFYYELHDGLFFIFPKDNAIAASEMFLDKLSNLPYKAAWGIDLPIKFPVDAMIGKSWGDLENLEKFKARM